MKTNYFLKIKIKFLISFKSCCLVKKYQVIGYAVIYILHCLRKIQRSKVRKYFERANVWRALPRSTLHKQTTNARWREQFLETEYYRCLLIEIKINCTNTIVFLYTEIYE